MKQVYCVPHIYHILENKTQSTWVSCCNYNAADKSIGHLCTEESYLRVWQPESIDSIIKCSRCHNSCPAMIRLAYHMGIEART